MTASEARQASPEGELSAAFDSLLATYNSLPRITDREWNNTGAGQDTRQEILADGSRVMMQYKKADSRDVSSRQDNIFVNITSAPQTGTRGELRQPATTFLLERSGLVSLCLEPLTLSIQGGDSTIHQSIGRVEVKISRTSPDNQRALRSMTPTMVDWAAGVVANKAYTNPPYTLSAHQ